MGKHFQLRPQDSLHLSMKPVNEQEYLFWLDQLAARYQRPARTVYYALCICSGKALGKSADAVTDREIIDAYFSDKLSDASIRAALPQAAGY